MSLTYIRALWKPRGDAAETQFTSARMNNIEAGVAGNSAPVVTVLPAASNGWAPFGSQPTTGQEVVLRVNDGSGAAVCFWRMIYVGDHAPTYPWYFVGGSPYRTYNAGATQWGTGGGGIAQTDGADPTFTTPAAGDYDVFFHALGEIRTGSAVDAFMGLMVDGAAAATGDSLEWFTGGSAMDTHASRENRVLGVGAAKVIRPAYNNSQPGTFYTYRRGMVIRPYRLI